jgi:hypothetical protein
MLLLTHTCFYMLAVMAFCARAGNSKSLFFLSPDIRPLILLLETLLQLCRQEHLACSFNRPRAGIFHIVVEALLHQSALFVIFLTLLPFFQNY